MCNRTLYADVALDERDALKQLASGKLLAKAGDTLGVDGRVRIALPKNVL